MWGFLIAQLVKNPPAMQETLVQFLGWKDLLEKGQATHSSILAWRIPWTGAWQAIVHAVAESDTTQQLKPKEMKALRGGQVIYMVKDLG